MLLVVLYPMILGLERIETTQLLRQNGVFQYLTGLPSYPEATTLRCFLLQVAHGGLQRFRTLHDCFLRRMLGQHRRPSRLTFDVDSTVLVVYGQQEGARRGYNPIKRGRPSSQLRGPVHGELRAGVPIPQRERATCLPCALRKIPAGVRLVIVQEDKGFYDHTLVEWLEARRARFVIVARLTAPVTRKLPHLRYTSPSRGVAVAEFRY